MNEHLAVVEIIALRNEEGIFQVPGEKGFGFTNLKLFKTELTGEATHSSVCLLRRSFTIASRRHSRFGDPHYYYY